MYLSSATRWSHELVGNDREQMREKLVVGVRIDIASGAVRKTAVREKSVIKKQWYPHLLE